MSIKKVNKNLESWFFFRMYSIKNTFEYYKELGYSDEQLENIKNPNELIKTYDHHINLDNWDSVKDDFYSQRLEEYPEKYTEQEKIKDEIKKATNLQINTNDESEKLIVRYIDFLNQKATKKNTPKDKASYIWQNNPDKELPELYNLMIGNYKLISSETSLEQFTEVFTGKSIKNIKPIKRTAKFTNSLLAYFVNELFYKSYPNSYLSIAEACFEAKNLSKAITNYSNNKSRKPKNFEIIDDIISQIKTS
ncbi:hypothetical protein [Winogradskyella poriferorum]|uniref:hypothetical protein n=1 Tax=Winogradskyella poriferorum TaxID=307627 RepID=UPI003D659BA2